MKNKKTMESPSVVMLVVFLFFIFLVILPLIILGPLNKTEAETIKLEPSPALGSIQKTLQDTKTSSSRPFVLTNTKTKTLEVILPGDDPDIPKYVERLLKAYPGYKLNIQIQL